MPDYQKGSSPVNNALPLSSEEIQYPLVSVVIVNYNGLKFLKECIQSLIAQTYKNLEIIVVDNASSDNSIEYLRSDFKGLQIIENSINLGFAGGVNTGIKNSHGEFIMTLNNDAWADPQCIEHLLLGMVDDHRTGMCAAKMLFPDKRINSAGICIARSGAAWDRGMFEADRGQYGKLEEIFGPCAGAALYRKDMFDEIGLFDEDFFLYMEDVDLAFRGRLAGWKCMFIPGAVVYHLHGGTAGFKSDLTIYYGNRNILWWPVKNYPFFTLLASLPWILGRTVGLIPYYAYHGKGKVILKSKIDGFSGIPMMLKKRKDIRRNVSHWEILKWMKVWSKSNKGDISNNFRDTKVETVT
jgi:GT2 family glycosyltransferase